MNKFKIVASIEQKNALLETLMLSGNFEISPADKANGDFTSNKNLDESIAKQARLAVAIDYLYKLNEDAFDFNAALKKTKKALRTMPPISGVNKRAAKKGASPLLLNVSTDDYATIRKNESSLFALCDKLLKHSENCKYIDLETQRLYDENTIVEPFTSVNIPLGSFKDTRTAGVILASGPIGSLKSSIERLECYVEEFECGSGVLWGVLCHIGDKKSVARKLNNLGFTLCDLTYDKTAKEVLKGNQEKIKELEKLKAAQFKSGIEYRDRLSELKTLYDAYGLEIEYAKEENNFVFSKDKIEIEGWVPQIHSKIIKTKLTDTFAGIEIDVRGVEAGEEPPSLLASSKLFTPFSGVTKGYSAPRYGERDPSPVMSIFFFVFFGIMLADAGYGLIMAVAGFIAGFVVKKLAPPTRRMVIMFAICGISGVIFGILFGSIFAIEGIPALMFNPIEEPILMLVFSIALGAVHLLTGYTLKTIAVISANYSKDLAMKTKIKIILDALFYSLFIYTLFGGIILLVIPMIFDASAGFTTAGIVLLAITLAGILLTGGRNAKTWVGRITGGLGGLYKLINIFSDVLSYARLFGLALASAAIAMAFNQIGMLLFGLPIIGYLLGAIILVVLHLFNFALSALAAYVHNIRLAYVEFYGKFYEGGGKDFAPLGEYTKYVRFVETINI